MGWTEAVKEVVKHPQGLYWVIIALTFAGSVHTFVPQAHSNSVTKGEFRSTVDDLNDTMVKLNCLLHKGQLRDLRRERADIEVKENKTARDRHDLIQLQNDIHDATRVRNMACPNVGGLGRS